MKILVIRFSSIGDVTQALSIPTAIKTKFNDAEIHFLTKTPFDELVINHPLIKKTWSFSKNQGLLKFFSLIQDLNTEKFDRIYDAHNNLRSNIFCFFISSSLKLKKPKDRMKRFLLIHFKKNKFKMPFSGQRDLIQPLEKWNIEIKIPTGQQLFISDEIFKKFQDLKNQLHIPNNYIALAPSAAHQFKKWPLENWIDIISSFPLHHFIVLAGPDDHFTQQMNHLKNVTNLTGQTTLILSAAFIAHAKLILANDTGLLHFAEQLNTPAIALMGAAPFGFPSKLTTRIVHKPPPCWPCSKHGQGPCTNNIFHQCMTDISTQEIKQLIEKLC